MRLRLVSLVLLAFALPIASAGATEAAPEASASAQAVAIRIVAPGQPGAVVGSVSAPPDAAASEGGFFYPADGSVLTSGAVTASTSAGTAGGNATAAASTDIASVSLFGGEVTIAAVAGRARASTSGGRTSGGLDGAGVSGLFVGGQAVGPGAGARVSLGDWGYAVTLRQSSGPGAAGPSFRAGMTALSIYLTVDHGGLPAGSEISLGYAEVSAQGASPPPPPPPPPPAPPPPPPPPPAVTTEPPPVVQPPPTSPAPKPRPKPRRPKPKPPALHTSPESEPARPQPKPPEPVEATPGTPPKVYVLPPNIQPLLTAGRYVFPVYGPSSYTDSYGAPRADVSYHHGEDIFAPLGTPLLAVADGTVFSVGWNHLGGYRLWLRDRQGNQFYYAHLSAYSPLAVNGRRVRAGEVLGFMGNTGDAVGTPYHIHFEIHPVGLLHLGYDGAVNPAPYLNAWRRLQDLPLGPVAGWAAPPIAAAGSKQGAPGVPQPPAPGAILIQATDISSADGLEPGSLRRVLAPASSEGDGALVGLVQTAPAGPHPVR